MYYQDNLKKYIYIQTYLYLKLHFEKQDKNQFKKKTKMLVRKIQVLCDPESLATSTGFVIWLELARTTVSPATQRAPTSSHSLLHLGPSYTLETNADKFFKSFLEEHLLCLGIYLIHFNLSLKIMTAGSKIILEFNFPGSKPD